MNRVLLTGLLLLALVALGCNKAADEEAQASQAQGKANTGEPTPLLAAGEGTPGVQVEQAPDPREAKAEYVELVKQIAPEYGIRYEAEKDMLYLEEGEALGSPAELASRVDMLLSPTSEPALGEPAEAIRFMLEGLTRQNQPEPPQPETPQVEEPVEAPLDLTNMNTEEMVAALAPEYNLTYDSTNKTLNGEGFRAGGVDVGIVVSKVDINLQQRGENNPQAREAEVRTALNQLAEAGRQAAAQHQQLGNAESAQEDSGAAQSGRGRKPLEYYPDSSELTHPMEVYGDWQSIREDHPKTNENKRNEVFHDDDFFYEMHLIFRGNAVFRLHKDGELYSDTEFPYRYDPRSGVLSLLGTDNEPVQTYTVWATEKDPLLIWLQREGSRIKVLYEKVGRGGEPTTLEEEVEGVRLMLGDEEAEAYREREKAKGRR